MGSMQEIMQLCRLCLMKDQVNTPIFENVDDISQVFIRISACLPIKVSREDALPKNICENCSYKLEIFYELLNTSVASEKQLLAWAKQLGVDRLPKVISTCSLSTTHVRPLVMKQEVSELLDPHSIDDLDASDDLDLTNQTQDYNISQQQLSYETVGFEFQPDQFIDNQTTTDIASKSTPKRKRSAIGLNIDLDSEDDAGLCSSKSAKTDGIHNGESDADDTAFDDLPSTSGENDQPGPSGIGKPSDSSSMGIYESTPIKYYLLSGSDDLQQTWILLTGPNVTEKLDSNNTDANKPNISHYNENLNGTEEIASEPNILHYNENLKGSQEPETLSIDIGLICQHCEDTFESKKLLLEHKCLSKKYIFICERCSSHYTSSFQLNLHIKFFHRNIYWCYVCTKDLSSEQQYIKHQRLHKENGNDVEHMCSVCKKYFQYRSSLLKHSLLHMDTEGNEPENKVFTCGKCNTTFRIKSLLMHHIYYNCIERTTTTAYVCDICGKPFATQGAFTNHKLFHIGVKMFYCPTCGKSFMNNTYLQKHIRRHSGVKKHECPVCHKYFTRHSTQVVHMRIHTGEKPFTCILCNKMFVSSHLLNVHCKKKHKIIKS